MNSEEQRKVFYKIVLASVKNVIGFGLAAAFIGYLSARINIDIVLRILGATVVFIIFVSLISLLLFIIYTFKNIPATLKNNPDNSSFWDLYGYTMAALSIRLVEAAICVAYIIYLGRIFAVFGL